jgi:hypothetical protein
MASMKLQLSQPERNLGLQWVVATIVGWGIGFFVCEALKPFFYDITHLGGDGLIIGASIGIAQGVVLRRRIASVGWWVFVTSVGFGVGKAAGEAAVQGMPAALGHALSGAIIGVAIGIAQWLILRRHVSRAEWWVLANIPAWALGWSLISLAEDSAGLSTLMIYVVGGVGAAVAGIITAMTLIWMSRLRPA